MKPAVRIILAPVASRHRDELRAGEASQRTIWLDPRCAYPAKTLYHELLHVRHPSWSEERVSDYEELHWPRLSFRYIANLVRMLATARLEGEA